MGCWGAERACGGAACSQHSILCLVRLRVRVRVRGRVKGRGVVRVSMLCR